MMACPIAVSLFSGDANTLQTMLRGLYLDVGEHYKAGW